MWSKVVLATARFFLAGVFAALVLVLLVWEWLTLGSWQRGEKLTLMPQAGLGAGRGVVLGDYDPGVRQLVVKENIEAADARPLIIKRYLEKYKSPLAPYSDLIFDLSQVYGFEYYWIVAIAQQESNLCKKIPQDSYNCWGYGVHSKGTLRFDDYETALKSFAEYLAREYFDKGLDTPELMMSKYCPHSNGSWAYGVRQFIEEMESGNY